MDPIVEDNQNKKALRSLAFLTFFLGIGGAFTAYINSSFLETFLNEKEISIMYSLSAIIAIIILLEMPKILVKICNHKILSTVIVATGLSLLVLIFIKEKYILIPAMLVYFTSGYILFFSRDIFIESVAKEETMGKTRGTVLVISNLGWVLAPFLAGIIITKFGFKPIYFIAFLMIILASIPLFGSIKKIKDKVYHKIPLKNTLKKVFTETGMRSIYLASFLLQFFYAIMVIYSPIYLSQNIGLPWDKIGIIFMIMLIPFVIFEYPVGKMSDKFGEKKFLILGFIICALATFLIPFLHTNSVAIWAIILFLTRVGASVIEVTTESYFFKHVKTEDADIISFFRNAYPSAYVIAPLFATVVFFVAPMSTIFYILAILMFCGILLASKLKTIMPRLTK